MRKCLFVFMMLLFAGVGAAWGQDTADSLYKVAVYVSGDRSGKPYDDSYVRSVEGTVTNVLVNSRQYKMIENMPAFKQKVNAARKTQASGEVRDEDIAKIGRDYGAQKICVVYVQFIEQDSYLQVDCHLVDVENTEIMVSGSKKKYDSDGRIRDINDAIDEVFGEMLGNSSNAGGNRGIFPTGADLTFIVGSVSFKMVFVKGGSMYLGSEECYALKVSANGGYRAPPSYIVCSSPSHNVTLTDYYMGETEVTQTLWKAVMGYSNNPSTWKGDLLPVESVSWEDCQIFISRLNSLLSSRLPQGYCFALPSEAQWEYAARGGQKSGGGMYAGSSNIDFMGWYIDNSRKCPNPVMQKLPNELGLYDMTGNVWEWCVDWCSRTFYSDNNNWTDPVNTHVSSARVLRGGSWTDDAEYCRVASRGEDGPASRSSAIGFRLSLVRR